MFMLVGYNMRCRIGAGAVLAVLLLAVCLLPAESKGGRGGGGSRGGSSSRGSSGSSRRGGTDYNRRNRPSNPPSPPRYQPPPQPKQTHDVPKSRPPSPAESHPPASGVRPSAPEAPKTNVVQQPAYNPNFKETNPHVGSANQPPHNAAGQNPAKLPPYSPQERPPPYAPAGGPPPYSPGGQGAGSYPQPPPGASYPRQPGAAPYPQQPGGAPPAYPGASYPQQPGGAPPAYPGASYPRQPGAAPYPQQPGGAPPGYPGASYPRQPGSASYPQQPGSSYPRQPGAAPYPQQPGSSYPRHPGGGGATYPGVAYPRQPGFTYPQTSQQMGANVWQPNAGRPPPSFMSSGGLPTGTNMQSTPYKKKGFLGSIFSMGGSKSHGKIKTPKHGSSLNPYGMAAMGGGVGALGAMGAMKYGKSAGMYAMLPYMAARRSGGLFGGSGFRMPLLMMMMFHRPHFGGYGYGGYGYGGYGYGHHGHRQHYYDVYSDNYVGRCNRPLTPIHGKIHCVSTEKEVDCEATCLEGYEFPDNQTRKENKCWHVGGVWRPSKNFPDCKPVCNESCFNNGTCSGPGLCACPPEYRGQLCEYHFLKCDMRHMAGNDVTWSCRHGKNETMCSVTCRPPLTFADPEIAQFHCSPNGTWAPDVIPPCVGEVEKTCAEKPDIGPCSAYQYPVWYYDAESGTCEKFVYGGCQGNGNRYSSGEECMKHCKGESKVPESNTTSVK